MKIKEAEIIIKIKNMIEAVCLERMVVEIMRNEEEVLNIEKIKESDKKNTSTMVEQHGEGQTQQQQLQLQLLKPISSIGNLGYRF
nr:hypothetical protein CTI12_AA094790 [Tanacetum cinerariifolium]